MHRAMRRGAHTAGAPMPAVVATRPPKREGGCESGCVPQLESERQRAGCALWHPVRRHSHPRWGGGAAQRAARDPKGNAPPHRPPSS